MEVFRAIHSGRQGPRRAACIGSQARAGWNILDRPDWRAMERPAGGVRQMVFRLPAIPALDIGRLVGAGAGNPQREQRSSTASPNDRLHDYPGASSGGGRKRGTQKEAFGRSKGGFTTKIHLIANALGLPVRAEISGGQVSDYKGYALLADSELPAAKVFIADRGYDSDAIRDDIGQRGGMPVIPGKRNRKQPISINSFAYAQRNRIERCFNKLKCSRRLATRYDKTAASYLAVIHIVAARLWVRSLST